MTEGSKNDSKTFSDYLYYSYIKTPL